MPSSPMFAWLVEFVKDPIRVLSALYSWFGWPASSLCVVAVWFAERPGDALARAPWFIGLASQFEEALRPVREFDATSVALVAIVVMIVLPLRAAVTEGWIDVEDCIDYVGRRYRPAVVTFWCVTLVGLEAHPASLHELVARFQRAAGVLWSFAWQPLLVIMGLLIVVTIGVLVCAHLDHSLSATDPIGELFREWVSGPANVVVSVVTGVWIMLLLAAFEVFERPVRILSFCLGLTDLQRPAPLWLSTPPPALFTPEA